MRSPIKAITALITLAALAVPTLAGAQEEPTRVLITNANVWDGTSDGLQNGMSVLVEGNLITQIAASIRAPSDLQWVIQPSLNPAQESLIYFGVRARATM